MNSEISEERRLFHFQLKNVPLSISAYNLYLSLRANNEPCMETLIRAKEKDNEERLFNDLMPQEGFNQINKTPFLKSLFNNARVLVSEADEVKPPTDLELRILDQSKGENQKVSKKYERVDKIIDSLLRLYSYIREKDEKSEQDLINTFFPNTQADDFKNFIERKSVESHFYLKQSVIKPI